MKNEAKPIKRINELVTQVNQKLTELRRPTVLALDGASGAGKSTVAALLAERLEAAPIPLDDFFSADIPDYQWDDLTVEEKRERVFQWQRLRTDCIEPFLQGKPAIWRAFDFDLGLQSGGTYQLSNQEKICMAAKAMTDLTLPEAMAEVRPAYEGCRTGRLKGQGFD